MTGIAPLCDYAVVPEYSSFYQPSFYQQQLSDSASDRSE